MSTLNVSNITDGTDTVETGYVLNGSAKAWCKFDNSATVADSLNISSTVDVGTGQWRFSKTNAMASTNYVVVGTNGYTIGAFAFGHNSNAIESSTDHTQSKYDASTPAFQDFTNASAYGMHTVHGDLA